MIYFSNVDINISKNIYDFLISQNFKEYMNNYKNKLMIFDFVAPIINDFKKNKKNLKILGISAFFHDSSAALIIDGEIINAVQEERFTRIKHDPSFPTKSITLLILAKK